MRRVLDEALASGEEPNKAKVKKAVQEIAPRRAKSLPVSKPSPGLGFDAICVRVKDAILVLSGLPPAAKVAEYFCSSDFSVLVANRHALAAAWLLEFSSAWKDN